MKNRAAIFTIILALLLAAPAPPAGARVSGGSARSYEYMINPAGGATIKNYNGRAVDLIIPDELDGYPVTAIRKRAFSGNERLISVVIPDGVVSIGDYAFEYCPALERVSIGAGVKSIGANPFYWCGSLKSIEVSPGNGSLAVVDRALFFEPEARLVTYPSGHDASEYTVPDFTETIGAGAFAACYALTGITIPDSVVAIEEDAFSHLTRLEYADIGGGVKTLGVNPFAGCKSLYDVRVADGNGSLEVMDRALITKPDMTLVSYFGGARAGLYDVPEGVRVIGAAAFIGCGNITKINLPGSAVKIEAAAFMDCGALRSVTLPEGMKRIEDRAFGGCPSLASVNLPEGMVHIAYDAFSDCPLLTLTVHRGSYAAKCAASLNIPRAYTD